MLDSSQLVCTKPARRGGLHAEEPGSRHFAVVLTQIVGIVRVSAHAIVVNGVSFWLRAIVVLRSIKGHAMTRIVLVVAVQHDASTERRGLD